MARQNAIYLPSYGRLYLRSTANLEHRNKGTHAVRGPPHGGAPPPPPLAFGLGPSIIHASSQENTYAGLPA